MICMRALMDHRRHVGPFSCAIPCARLASLSNDMSEPHDSLSFIREEAGVDRLHAPQVHRRLDHGHSPDWTLMGRNEHPEPLPESEAAADLIAQLAHRNQVDKSGKPYIDHPRRVAAIVRANGYDRRYSTVALLHDVVEDTEVTQDDLRAVFGAAISDAVDHLTRREGEPSEDYYARVLLSDLSLVVKHADIMDNTSPRRLAALDLVTQERLSAKYNNAITQLGGPLLPARD